MTHWLNLAYISNHIMIAGDKYKHVGSFVTTNDRVGTGYERLGLGFIKGFDRIKKTSMLKKNHMEGTTIVTFSQ